MNKYMINLINNYQKNISPNTSKKCRFIPTCSQYAKECYERFNFVYASALVSARLMKCNPFHKMAIDPVPEQRKYRHKFRTLEESIEWIELSELIKNEGQ